MNLIEKILAKHANKSEVKSDEIIDVFIDTRAARDFGGANVVKNLLDNGLKVNDASKTCFTFDCNPGGSDQKYAQNQQYCRQYARENGIAVYDVNTGIGTHLAIDSGLAWPGSTFVSTDSHANIMGAIGSFGQGMGDQDIAAAWAKGAVWFKVPRSVKINLNGKRPADVSAKDIVLNLLSIFGANKLLGFSVEIYGEAVEKFTLDERITISSMATEMGAIILLFTPSPEIMKYCEEKTGHKLELIKADANAKYEQVHDIDISKFVPMVAKPGHPHDDTSVASVKKSKIDSAFIGSCTNGRIEDMRIAAAILKNKKVAPGVVLKIVPSTDAVWNQCMNEGLINIFKDAGAMVSNAGCAGCAAGQIGQNGPGEVTISTGNRNFEGKQGKGFVYLASPAVVAASAIAGFITTPDDIPQQPAVFEKKEYMKKSAVVKKEIAEKPLVVEGRVWIIKKDDIDTDMIYHNRYLTITDIKEMGQYSFDNLKGYEDFAKKAKAGDIIITAKNFGAGSSRQQAVDCFISLGISCILAESYGAIYERNAINAAMPILTYNPEKIAVIDLQDGDKIKVDMAQGKVTNLKNNKTADIDKFTDVQIAIYKNGGLL
ncbi:MAG TPA: aconitase/3-isopropylmalate dehydratase large subunit family protein [Bacteroidales bacterium]|nr:aconitase/3-isopropylmalate dehydratase large subunit family protein [Bacteroidales bacterium]HPS18418.1 aconitase/3-isopropylmalate dehydratase large subunit family protein [Bacteroidales bacterium]